MRKTSKPKTTPEDIYKYMRSTATEGISTVTLSEVARHFGYKAPNGNGFLANIKFLKESNLIEESTTDKGKKCWKVNKTNTKKFPSRKEIKDKKNNTIESHKKDTKITKIIDNNPIQKEVTGNSKKDILSNIPKHEASVEGRVTKKVSKRIGNILVNPALLKVNVENNTSYIICTSIAKALSIKPHDVHNALARADKRIEQYLKKINNTKCVAAEGATYVLERLVAATSKEATEFLLDYIETNYISNKENNSSTNNIEIKKDDTNINNEKDLNDASVEKVIKDTVDNNANSNKEDKEDISDNSNNKEDSNNVDIKEVTKTVIDSDIAKNNKPSKIKTEEAEIEIVNNLVGAINRNEEPIDTVVNNNISEKYSENLDKILMDMDSAAIAIDNHSVDINDNSFNIDELSDLNMDDILNIDKEDDKEGLQEALAFVYNLNNMAVGYKKYEQETKELKQQIEPYKQTVKQLKYVVEDMIQKYKKVKAERDALKACVLQYKNLVQREQEAEKKK